jgi:hypothetical protein
VADEADILHLVAQRLEGGGIAGIEGESGEEVPACVQVGLARERGAALLHALGHLTLDARLQAALHFRHRAVVGIDGERDRPLGERRAQRAVFLERFRLLPVGGRERLARRGRPHGDRALRGRRARGRRLSRGRGGTAGERQRGGEGGDGARPHLMGSAAKVLRFFTKSSSVISA